MFFVTRAYRANGSDVELTRYRGWRDGGAPLAPGSTGPGSVETPPEVTPRPGDYTIVKPRFSAFFQTELDLILRRLGVHTLYLAGTTTPNCIRTTCYDALSLDYNVVLLEDCTSSRTPEVQAANIADMAHIGTQVISCAQFCDRGLADVRDVEAEVADAVAQGAASAVGTVSAQ